MLLWPDYPFPHVLDPLDGRDEYFPNGLHNTTMDAFASISRLRHLLSYCGPEMGFVLLDYFEGNQPRPHAPWKYLFTKAQQALERMLSPDTNLNSDAKKSITLDIDNSIRIATLSRRLIIGESLLRSTPVTGNQFYGLGPAGTVKGDEVFLLTGGKTPFVLRWRGDADDTIPGPKYEIIGDCYLQGWMDGEGEDLALDLWGDITLV